MSSRYSFWPQTRPFLSFFLSRHNKFDEYKVSSQATAWIKK